MNELIPGHLLQDGKYKIVKVLGQGGFGITYLAEQTVFEELVCIKEFFMKDYCNRTEGEDTVTVPTVSNVPFVQNYRNKFIKEAKVVFKLHHQNIVRVIDIFTENDTDYYVMDYIKGTNLNDIIKQKGALPELESLNIIRQIGSALSYVHHMNLTHLDVKPANIMVRTEDGMNILIDFGMSKQYDQSGEQTSSTPVGISAGYAPLEQYSPGAMNVFSPQTDIYSLGAVLYRLVTGQVPPPASDVMNEGLPEITTDITEKTKAAIEKAMQFRKKDRPVSVEAFMDMLSSSSELDDSNTDEVQLSTAFEHTVEQESKLAQGNSSEENNEDTLIVTSEIDNEATVIIDQEVNISDVEEDGISNNECCTSDDISSDLSLDDNGSECNETNPVSEVQETDEAEQVSTSYSYLYLSSSCIGLVGDIFDNMPGGENLKMNSERNYNSEFVDLGLSVKWAKCNLGASKPEEFGDYYAWGETDIKSNYCSNTYKFGKAKPFSKYQPREEVLVAKHLFKSDEYKTVGDGRIILEPSDDVVHVKLGGNWRMPTDDEFEELQDECEWIWTEENGVNGCKVVGPNGNSIFLPAAGYRPNEDLSNLGSLGYYWSSSLDFDYSPGAWYLCFDSDGYLRLYDDRFHGFSVRPVKE